MKVIFTNGCKKGSLIDWKFNLFFFFFRAATTDECDCDKLDFAAAKALSKEGLGQFSQERTTIAVLNDRLVRLIEMVREVLTTSHRTHQCCFHFCCLVSEHSLHLPGPLLWRGEQLSWKPGCRAQREAERTTRLRQQHLHCGSVWLQSGCGGDTAAQGEGRFCCFSCSCCTFLAFAISTASRPSSPGRKQHFSASSLQDEILQDTEKLQVELECLMKECEEAAQQRTLLWQEQRGIAEVNMNGAQSKAVAHPRYSLDEKGCSGNIICLIWKVSDKTVTVTNTLSLSFDEYWEQHLRENLFDEWFFLSWQHIWKSKS